MPACEIRALAREWAKKNTFLAAGGLGGWGGACRASHGIEWARGMIALATMQGMGKPGSNIWSTTQGAPVDYDFYFPGYAEGGISGDCENSAAGFKFAWRMFDGKTTFPSPSNINTSAGQHIPRLKVPECIMDGKFQWAGKGFAGGDIQHQMHQYQYPAPGYPRIKMLWKYGGPWIGTMTATNRYAKMYTHDEPGVRRQPVHLVRGRGAVRRHHPAGLHQLRALGHLASSPTAPATSPTTTTSATTA